MVRAGPQDAAAAQHEGAVSALQAEVEGLKGRLKQELAAKGSEQKDAQVAPLPHSSGCLPRLGCCPCPR